MFLSKKFLVQGGRTLNLVLARPATSSLSKPSFAYPFYNKFGFASSTKNGADQQGSHILEVDPCKS